MHKSILSILAIALLATVVFSGCVTTKSNNTPTTPDVTAVVPPGDAMQKSTPAEVADAVSGTSGVTESELNEVDALVEDIDSSTTEIQESNI